MVYCRILNSFMCYTVGLCLTLLYNRCEHNCKSTMCSDAQLCPTLCNPWTIEHQAPLSMGFSQQEQWNMVPFPPPGDLPNPRIKTTSLTSPTLAGRFFTTSVNWEACKSTTLQLKKNSKVIILQLKYWNLEKEKKSSYYPVPNTPNALRIKA